LDACETARLDAFELCIYIQHRRAALQAGRSAACDEPGYSESSESSAGEELLLVGGGGDLRYTLSLRPAMSLSRSNWLTRPVEGFALKRSSSSKQRGDLEAIVGAFSVTVGPGALIEVLPRGGGGDLRYTLNARPVTSLSNSNRLTRSMERLEMGPCPSQQLGAVETFVLLP